MIPSPRQHEVVRHELRDQFLRVRKRAERAEQSHLNFSKKCSVVVALIGKQNVARVHAEEMNLGESVDINLFGSCKADERRYCGNTSLSAAHHAHPAFIISRPFETPYACSYSNDKRAFRCDSKSHHTEALGPSALRCVKIYSFAEVAYRDRSTTADDSEKNADLSSRDRCATHAAFMRGSA